MNITQMTPHGSLRQPSARASLQRATLGSETSPRNRILLAEVGGMRAPRLQLFPRSPPPNIEFVLLNGLVHTK